MFMDDYRKKAKQTYDAIRGNLRKVFSWCQQWKCESYKIVEKYENESLSLFIDFHSHFYLLSMPRASIYSFALLLMMLEEIVACSSFFLNFSLLAQCVICSSKATTSICNSCVRLNTRNIYIHRNEKWFKLKWMNERCFE